MRCSKPSVAEKDGFRAQQSRHVTIETKADGDTWQETLAVCEMGGKLTIRSYYTNRRTDEKKWDEPPSGASRVLNATETMRRMANIQLTEMQIATGTYKDPDQLNTAKKNKGVFGSLFRRSKVEKKDGGQTKSRIQYKPDSFIGKTKRKSNKNNQFDESLNPAMQQALASSLSSFNENEQINDFNDAEDVALDHHRVDEEQSLEFTKALQSDPSPPDPPEYLNSTPNDGSVVLHEVNFSEEEALEMALKLSLAEVQKQYGSHCTDEPEKAPGIAVASIPEISDDVEEEEIKIKEIDDTNSDHKPGVLIAENSKMPAVTVATTLSDVKNANGERNMDGGALPCKEAQSEQHFVFGGAASQIPMVKKKSHPQKDKNEKSRQRRQLTSEELAAKEERMLQRAIKESMKNSQSTSPSLDKSTEEKEKEKSSNINEDSQHETESSISGQDSNAAHLNQLSTASYSQDNANTAQDLLTEKNNTRKGRHEKNRQRRRLTEEELAAKEERMLQRAINESMKGSENTSPHRGRALEHEKGLKTSQHSQSSMASERRKSRSPRRNNRPPLPPQRERVTSRSPPRERDLSRAQSSHKNEKRRSKNRRPTPEELAAKEEEMLQKALKASLEE